VIVVGVKIGSDRAAMASILDFSLAMLLKIPAKFDLKWNIATTNNYIYIDGQLSSA
jgi:hypothetical protein